MSCLQIHAHTKTFILIQHFDTCNIYVYIYIYIYIYIYSHFRARTSVIFNSEASVIHQLTLAGLALADADLQSHCLDRESRRLLSNAGPILAIGLLRLRDIYIYIYMHNANHLT